MKHGFIMKDEAHRRSMSLDPVDFEPATPTKSRLRSDTDKQAKQIDKGFLPFVLGKHMRLAPHNVFLPDTEDLMRVNEDMDSYAKHPPSPTPSVMESFATLKRRRGFQPPKVEHVIHKLQGSSNRPIDLTQNHENRPRDALNTIPIKYFSYGEDVRPPYRGTWTRMVDDRTARKLALQPVAQQLPEVDYNYDSEAEWEDVEEGEDLEAEDIEEEEEQDEEVDGFIDDDNAPQYLARRGIPASDVESKCSGLQWEDASGKMRAADARYGNANFSEFTVCFLLGQCTCCVRVESPANIRTDPSPKTIDPFTTAYWDPEPKQVSSTLPLTSSMGPPRLPLQDRTNGQATMQITLVNGKVPKAAKVGPRLVPADLMPAFKAAVSGSDMTKIALIEALKKQ
jgi:chromatin assembly factor 1 subunit A